MWTRAVAFASEMWWPDSVVAATATSTAHSGNSHQRRTTCAAALPRVNSGLTRLLPTLPIPCYPRSSRAYIDPAWRAASGCQLPQRPAVAVSAELAAPVQPVLAVFPELDRVRHQQIAAPVWWPLHRAVCPAPLLLGIGVEQRLT